MGDLLDQAWMRFNKAVGFDEKTRDASKTEGFHRIAAKARDKELDKACALEAEALAEGEKHA